MAPTRPLFVTCIVLLFLAGPCRSLPAEDSPPSDAIPQLVEDLRADRVRFNAHRAVDRLTEIGRPAFDPLQRALRSEDWQQRHMAAAVLVRLAGEGGDNPVEPEPTPRLLKVLVEGLRHDPLPSGQADGKHRYNLVFNARHGTEYLARHMGKARPLLREALDSDDGQQQFLAACLLGWAGDTKHVEALAAILLPRLRDNTLRYDALLAAPALYRLGAGRATPP